MVKKKKKKRIIDLMSRGQISTPLDHPFDPCHRWALLSMSISSFLQRPDTDQLLQWQQQFSLLPHPGPGPPIDTPPPTFILSPILWECFFPCLGWFLCLVIRYVLVTYIWRHSWHSNWLGIGPVSLSDGKCLISAETGGTRISNTSPSLKNLANVSVWQLYLLLF